MQAGLAEELGEGLIVLSGAQAGPVGQALVQGDDAARGRGGAAAGLASFPHRFYIELQRAGRHDDEAHVAAAVQLAARLKLPVVATHPVQFTTRRLRGARGAGVHLRRRDPGQPAARAPLHARAVFQEHRRDAGAVCRCALRIANTVEIARRCNLTLVLGKPQLPDFPTPGGMPIEAYFRLASHEGLEGAPAPLYPDAARREQQRPRYQWSGWSSRSPPS
jgi:DNA polymerase-3 subunit alpha